MGSAVAKRVFGWLFSLVPHGAASLGLRHWRFLRQLVPPGRDHLFPKYLGRFSVCIDTRYPIERRMWAGTYEIDILRVIRRFAPAGGVCLDIGANVGALTLVMADAVGPAGKVHAFEPNPAIHRRLLRNLGLNPELRDVVTPHAVALGRAPGRLFYTEEEGNPGNGRLGVTGDVEVRVERLDDLADRLDLRRLDLVKIDVEGMEVDVFEGARATLERFRPVICFETLFLRRAGPHSAEEEAVAERYSSVERFLSGIGYRMHRVDAAMALPEVDAGRFGKNTLAMPRVGLPPNPT